MSDMALVVGRVVNGAYQPPLLHRLLSPRISGNAVNGFGEPQPRRPSPVYWHDPRRIAHGWLQRLIALRFRFHPVFWRVGIENMRRQARPPAPVAAEREAAAPAEWSRRVREFALSHHADLVGIAPLDPAWVFEGFTVNAPWLVMLGVAMEHDRLATAPQPDSVVEVMAQYNRGLRAAHALADWIRARGHQATGHCGPMAGPINLIPAALACGFGELGKHGSIINRRFGSSFRLACVLTELPLEADAPDEFGADDFCRSCQLCTRSCPPQAIFAEKQLVRGEHKWYVDFDRCIPYFNDTFGCAICIAVCPWSRPALTATLVRKMAARRAAAGCVSD